nr:ISAzo13 family transposase [Deltaproteobacteria bacterium]
MSCRWAAVLAVGFVALEVVGRAPNIDFPRLPRTLAALVDDATAGDPMATLRWTHASLRTLVGELRRKGIRVGRSTVQRLLRARRYSLRVNQKCIGGPHSPERDAQFRRIHAWQRHFLHAGWPVLSIDTKKKEPVGLFKNVGRTYRRHPRRVRDHDFRRDADGLAVPYGIYDVGRRSGFVVLGRSHDTAAFAVAALRAWWRAQGRRRCPHARRWLLLADCGGGNGSRNAAWKVQLQRLADDLRVTITVLHYPAGASKWNPVEHRLFSRISENWAGRPLISFPTMLQYIRGTRMASGRRCSAVMDPRHYPKGVKPTKEQRAAIKIYEHTTLPKWGYTIGPHHRN